MSLVFQQSEAVRRRIARSLAVGRFLTDECIACVFEACTNVPADVELMRPSIAYALSLGAAVENMPDISGKR